MRGGLSNKTPPIRPNAYSARPQRSKHALPIFLGNVPCIMDPITAASLAGTCTALVTKLASAAKGLHAVVAGLHDAGHTIKHLADQVDLMEIVFRRLNQSINDIPGVTQHERDKFHSGISSCDVVVSDLLLHVQSIQPAEGETGPSLARRVRLLWNDEQVKEKLAMLNTSLQLFQTFLVVLQLSPGAGRGQILSSSSAQLLMSKTIDDAQSIIVESRRGESTSGATFTDAGEDLDRRFAVDEELLDTEVYRLAIRSTVRRREGRRRDVLPSTAEKPLPSDSSMSSMVAQVAWKPPPETAPPPATAPLKKKTNRGSSLLSWIKSEIRKTDPRKVIPRELTPREIEKLESFCWDIETGRTPVTSGDLGFDINGHTSRGETPLALSIRCGRLDMVRYLLQEGASVRAGFRREWSVTKQEDTKLKHWEVLPPLHYAALFKAGKDITQLLVEKGADINDREGVKVLKDERATGITPLVAAIDARYHQGIGDMIGLGADIDRPTTGTFVWTPLTYAITVSSLTAVRLLCEAGASVNSETTCHMKEQCWTDTWNREEQGIPHQMAMRDTALTFVTRRITRGKWRREEAEFGAEVIEILVSAGADVRHQSKILGKWEDGKEPENRWSTDTNGISIHLRGAPLDHLCASSSDGWPIRAHQFPRVLTATLYAIHALVDAGSNVDATVRLLSYHRLPTPDFPLRMKAMDFLIEAGAVVPRLDSGVDYMELFCSQLTVGDGADFKEGLEQVVQLTVFLIKAISPYPLSTLQNAIRVSEMRYEEEMRPPDNKGGFFNTRDLCRLRRKAVTEMLRWAAKCGQKSLECHLDEDQGDLWDRIRDLRIFGKYEEEWSKSVVVPFSNMGPDDDSISESVYRLIIGPD